MLRRSIPSFASRKADVVIIGSGIIGSTLALELARSNPEANRKILIIDKNAKAGMGTTGWSSGIIRSMYTVEQSVRISWECYHIWKSWFDYLQLSDPELTHPMRKLPLWLCESNTTRDMISNFSKVAKDCNIPVQHLDLQETRKIAERIGWDISVNYSPRQLDDPEFSTPVASNPIVGSLLVPETGYVADPFYATQNVYKACATNHKNNIDFLFNTKIVDITRGPATRSSWKKSNVGISSVTLSNGDVVETPVVVNCAGPYSSEIDRMIYSKNDQQQNQQQHFVASDATVTCKPLRVECAFVEGPPGLDCEKDGVITFDCDTGFYLKPEGRGRFLVGGLDLKEDVLRYVNTSELPDTEVGGQDHQPADEAFLCLCRYALRVPKALIPSSPDRVKGFVASYDVSQDWSPILDCTNVQGYYVAAGTSGNAFKMAPLFARMMSRIINATENGVTEEQLHGLSVELPITESNADKQKKKRIPLDVYNRKRNVFDIFGGVIG